MGISKHIAGKRSDLFGLALFTVCITSGLAGCDVLSEKSRLYTDRAPG